jgi:hypothetical protein
MTTQKLETLALNTIAIVVPVLYCIAWVLVFMFLLAQKLVRMYKKVHIVIEPKVRKFILAQLGLVQDEVPMSLNQVSYDVNVLFLKAISKVLGTVKCIH